MELKVSHEDGYVLAATAGPIDDAAVDLFRESLHPLVARSGTKLVIDLSQSNYITSLGIGQLITVVTHANSSDSRVVIAACSPFISVVINRCKLDKFFDMAESVPEAVRQLLG